MAADFSELYEAATRSTDEAILMHALVQFDLRADVRPLLDELPAEAFASVARQKIWGAAQELARADRIITYDSLRELAPSLDKTIDGFGEPVRLVEVTRGIQLVREAWQKRRLLQVLDAAANATPELEYEASAGRLHDALQSLDAESLVDGSWDSGEIVDRFWASIDDPEGERPKLVTPWPKMNAALGGGLRPGQLVSVGAATGSGKSIILNQLAARGVRDGRSVAMFSLEMDELECVRRMVSAETGVRTSLLTRERLTAELRAKVESYTEAVRAGRLRVFDAAGIDMDFVNRKSRVMHRQGGLDLVCVDYIQILDGDNPGNREAEVSGIAKNMKTLARSLPTVVVSASQLNESHEDGAPPTLRSLRESRGIGHHSDIVILLHREKDVEGITNDGFTNNIDFNIAKARNFAPARFLCIWEAERARITEGGQF